MFYYDLFAIAAITYILVSYFLRFLRGRMAVEYEPCRWFLSVAIPVETWREIHILTIRFALPPSYLSHFFFPRCLDYMWSSVKDPIDTPLTFDKDGLDLAFKYFTSSTLTMRLAGIAQINSHITSFNDICNSENMLEAEGVGQNLTTWLIDNNIISHIFGPNLHVEVFTR